MRTVRFIHTADLHLDAAFSGLSAQAPPELLAELHNAPFTALKRLEALCLAERPDFLVIAGDLYNEEDGSLAARIAVRELCASLDQAAIPVFIAHGNHDPLSSRMKTLVWPSNVTVFGEEVRTVPLISGHEPMAVLHGISHATGHEERNLAGLFRRAQFIRQPGRGSSARLTNADALPQIGVLHCTVGDAPLRYAPCTVTDLEESGLDCWALGHVHARSVFGRRGHISYPGSLQGLHINEAGPHGCQLTTLRGRDSVEHTFFPLAPVQWRELHIDLSELEAARSLLDIHDQSLARLFAAVEREEAAPNSVDLTVVRLIYTGRSSLDSLLRRAGQLPELLENLRKSALSGQPRVWVKDIVRASGPETDLALLRADRGDLLGESLRCANALATNPDDLAGLADELFADLFKNRLMRDAIGAFSPEERQDLLKAAELACLDLLEPEETEAD